MSKVEISLNSQGLIELMKSEEIQGELAKHAQEIVSRCGGVYDTDIYIGKTRANASIVTHDSATYHRNLKDNELLKALQ